MSPVVAIFTYAIAMKLVIDGHLSWLSAGVLAAAVPLAVQTLLSAILYSKTEFVWGDYVNLPIILTVGLQIGVASTAFYLLERYDSYTAWITLGVGGCVAFVFVVPALVGWLT